jgi:predicted transcriptional regulator
MVLLSVRPRFAEALLDGSKTVEVRRRRARIIDGALCLVYASSPKCALLGAIRVETTDIACPDVLWARHGNAMCLERDEYDSYLEGARQPCAIVVAATTTFATPVELPDLRCRVGSFVTPQSYRFLRDRELASILNGQLLQLDELATDAAAPLF